MRERNDSGANRKVGETTQRRTEKWAKRLGGETTLGRTGKWAKRPGFTRTYERTSTDEKSIVDNHCCHITTKFAVGISENQEKISTLYWLPKLHKRPYKSRFIANSSSCTPTELSKLLTSCLTAVKNHLIKYYDTCYERDGISRF